MRTSSINSRPAPAILIQKPKYIVTPHRTPVYSTAGNGPFSSGLYTTPFNSSVPLGNVTTSADIDAEKPTNKIAKIVSHDAFTFRPPPIPFLTEPIPQLSAHAPAARI
jgi:hypothetical protein